MIAKQTPDLSEPDLPAAIGPESSPFWPQHLLDLLPRPTRFFRDHLALGRTPYVILVTWALGMSSVVDRVDRRIMQEELRDDPARWQALESLLSTWPAMWAFVLAGGLVGGALYWWIGGWWCRIRLGWSGAESPDKRLARLSIIYSSFVFAGPAVVSLVGQSLMYDNYLEAYESEYIFSSIVLIVVFWSMFTTYKGALALFSISRRRAQLWFIALAAVVCFLVMGGVAFLLPAAV